MNRAVLFSAGRTTTDIGFGTAGLTSTGSERDALRLMEAAFDAGITHFDTAPLYGRGQAEGIVGKFSRRKRERVTLTTKVGLYPSAIDRTFRAFFGPLRRIKRALSGEADGGFGGPDARVRGDFDPQQVKASFEASLRQLQTDYVDLLLLHECFVEDTQRVELIDFIDREIGRGTVRSAGIGTARSNLEDDHDAVPDVYRVFQYEHNLSAGEALPGFSNRALITHSALGPLERIVSLARNDQTRAAKAQAASGIDFANTIAIAPMLLAWARHANPNGMLLFATTSIDHLRTNASSLRRTDAEQVARFACAARELLAP